MVAGLASMMVTKPPKADKKFNQSTKAGKPSDNRGTTHPDHLLSENSESIAADGFGISVGGGPGKKGKANSMDTNA